MLIKMLIPSWKILIALIRLYNRQLEIQAHKPMWGMETRIWATKNPMWETKTPAQNPNYKGVVTDVELVGINSNVHPSCVKRGLRFENIACIYRNV